MNIFIYILKLPYRLIALAYNGLILSFVMVGFVAEKVNEKADKEEKSEHNSDANIPLELDSLFNEDYGTHAKYKNNYNKILSDLGFSPNNTESKRKQAKINEQKNEKIRKKEPLKKQGDLYETYIGKQFEKKRDLVIYNGFIHGHNDHGVDLVCFSKKNKTVNIIQCKNWHHRQFTLSNIEDVYKQLNLFEKYRIYSSIKLHESINLYLDKPWLVRDILRLEIEIPEFKVHKTLYLSNENIVDLEVGEHLKVMGKNIFKYKNMKMVIAPIK